MVVPKSRKKQEKLKKSGLERQETWERRKTEKEYLKIGKVGFGKIGNTEEASQGGLA